MLFIQNFLSLRHLIVSLHTAQGSSHLKTGTITFCSCGFSLHHFKNFTRAYAQTQYEEKSVDQFVNRTFL